MYFGNICLALLFLISSALLAGMTTALLQMGRLRAREEFKKIPSLFFFQHFLKPLFGTKKWEGLFFTLSFSKHVLHLCFCVITIFILLTQAPFLHALKLLETHTYTYDSLWVLAIGAIIIVISLVADMLMKFLATAAPVLSLKLFAPLSSVFLTIFAPLTAFIMKLLQTFFPESKAETPTAPTIRDKILEVLYESELSTHLDPQERKLIISVANFKGRNVREARRTKYVVV